MAITSILMRPLMAARTVDMMRCVFLCFVLDLIVNVFFVFDQNPMILEKERRVYPGYFMLKRVLGECSAFTLLLSFNEILCPGWQRRVMHYCYLLY